MSKQWFNRLAISVAAGLCFFLQGCLIIPFPNSRIEGNGVSSTLVDADNGRPIALARVAIEGARGHPRAAVTDSLGRFRITPHVQWHAAYLLSPISYPIWPFTGDVIIGDCAIRVAAPGYEDSVIEISAFPEGVRPSVTRPTTRVLGANEKDGVFIIPSIAMKRIGPAIGGDIHE